MLCGDQDPVFTREEIMKYTEPNLGYSKESPGFLLNVLVEMKGAEESLPAVHHRLLLHPSWRRQPVSA